MSTLSIINNSYLVRAVAGVGGRSGELNVVLCYVYTVYCFIFYIILSYSILIKFFSLLLLPLFKI